MTHTADKETLTGTSLLMPCNCLLFHLLLHSAMFSYHPPLILISHRELPGISLSMRTQKSCLIILICFSFQCHSAPLLFLCHLTCTTVTTLYVSIPFLAPFFLKTHLKCRITLVCRKSVGNDRCFSQ